MPAMKPQDGDSAAFPAEPVPAPGPRPPGLPGAIRPGAQADTLWMVNAALAERLALQRAELNEQRLQVQRLGARMAALLQSTSWRVTGPLRAGANAWGQWRRARQRADAAPASVGVSGPAVRLGYAQWIQRYDRLDARDLAALRRLAADPALPSLRVLVVFDAANAANGANVVRRLGGQIFERWSATLLFFPGCAPAALAAARAAAAADTRCLVLDDAVGLQSTAVAPGSGDCLVLCAGDVLLREHALGLLAGAARSGVRLVYADEDSIDAAGRRSSPFFKPDFSRELQRNCPLLEGAVLVTGTPETLGDLLPGIIAGRSGGAPAALRSALDALLATIADAEVAHVPLLLCHRATQFGRAALPHMPVAAVPAGEPLPAASIIIPTRDGIEWLATCLSSIHGQTIYPAGQLEVIVVDNGSVDPAMLAYLELAQASGQARVLHDPQPFNFARLNNRAARAAQGQILVFVNNDTKVDDAFWLQRLALAALQADVGAVGGKLLYADRTVQHAGVVLGLGAVAGHCFVGLAEDDGGYHGLACTTREVAAVTGACLAIRRQVFERIGGFREELAVAFNDVALCLDALALGYRNLCIGQPLLLHFESQSRGMDDTPEKKAVYAREAALMRRIYGARLERDPYYNPNLSLVEGYALAVPPRAGKPWRGDAAPR